MMATFRHTALKDNTLHFRLLEVYSGEGCELRTKLIEYEVTRAVPYEAVSYAWGAEPDGSFNVDEEPYIRIGGFYHRITWSLRKAIEVFRFSNRSRTLWIDQICINQSKTEEGKLEKDGQLPLMGKIYQNAKQTLIWLGPHHANHISAASIMKAYGSLRKDIESWVKRSFEEGSSKLQQAALVYSVAKMDKSEQREYGISSASDLPNISTEQVELIIDFYSISWFTRTWPIQEVVLSGRKIVHIGLHQFDWTDIGFFATWFLHHYDHLNISEPRAKGLQAANYVNWYAQVYENGFPLTSLLRMIRKHNATEPKDKLFVLLDMIDFNLDSLGQPYSKPIPSKTIPNALMPSYRKYVDEVYHDLICYQLAVERKVHLLTFVQHPYYLGSSKRLNSPSWVPVWDQGEQTEPLWFPEAPAANFSAAPPDPTQFTFEFKFSHREKKLFKTCAIEGIEISHVTTTHDPDNNEQRNESHGTASFIYMTTWLDIDILSRWEEDTKVLFFKKKFPDGLWQPLAMVLTADRQLPPDGIIRPDDDTAYQHQMQRFASWVCTLDTSARPSLHRLQKQLRADNRYTINAEDAKQYSKRVVSVCRNRCLFRTENGMLGLGPALVRTCDTVCVLRKRTSAFCASEDDKLWQAKKLAR